MKKNQKLPFKMGQLDVMEHILNNNGSIGRDKSMKLVKFAKSFLEDQEKLEEVILERGDEVQVKQVERKRKKRKESAKEPSQETVQESSPEE